MKARLAIPAAALWFCASAALAAFDTATVCTGAMRFYNDDASFDTYALRLEFEGPRYRIQATSDDEQSDPTDDRGQCDAYLDDGCRFSFDLDDGTQQHYDFRLEPRGGDRYLYSEIWNDGVSGSSLLTCTAD